MEVIKVVSECSHEPNTILLVTIALALVYSFVMTGATTYLYGRLKKEEVKEESSEG